MNQQMIYLLEYELKSKHGEDFRKIYKGRAFKCIITDLIANTQYRFRVAPILVKESGIEVSGAIYEGRSKESGIRTQLP